MERGSLNPVVLTSTKKNCTPSSPRGFSLIELLVVVAIIGLLLSVIVPSLEKAKTRVRNVTCQSNLRQWSMCFVMYTEDNDRFLPSSGRNWVQALNPYYEGSRDLLCCPLASSTQGGGGDTHIAYQDRTGSSPEDWVVGSYGINGWASNLSSDTAIYGVSPNNAWRKMQADSASSVPLVLDSLWVVAYPDVTNLPPAKDGDFESCDLSGQGRRQIRHFCFDRHGNGSINALFMDMSNRSVGLKELWRLKWHRGTDLTTPPPAWPEWMQSMQEY